MVRKIKVEPSRHPMEAALPYTGQPNPIEQEFRQLAESQGWDVTKRGWPDFICRRNGELMAVEVKGPHDGLSREQYQAISDLRRAGIPTFVWSPDTGFTEVGPPVAESVFSIKATEARIREAAEKANEPTPIRPPITWLFDEQDPATLRLVRGACLGRHSTHKNYPVFGKTGSWCSDLLAATARYSADEIFLLTGLPNREKFDRNIGKIRQWAFEVAHTAIHAQIGLDRYCTQCANAA